MSSSGVGERHGNHAPLAHRAGEEYGYPKGWILSTLWALPAWRGSPSGLCQPSPVRVPGTPLSRGLPGACSHCRGFMLPWAALGACTPSHPRSRAPPSAATRGQRAAPLPSIRLHTFAPVPRTGRLGNERTRARWGCPPVQGAFRASHPVSSLHRVHSPLPA